MTDLLYLVGFITWPVATLYFVGFIVLEVGTRIFADRLDRSRIRDEIVGSGGEVLDITWSPFGRGWFGERSDRIYEVTYRPKNGKTLTATCKTSLFTGVFWSSETPPSDFADQPNSGSSSSPLQPQPDVCGQCGISLRPGRTGCHWCGWRPKSSDKSTPSNRNAS